MIRISIRVKKQCEARCPGCYVAAPDMCTIVEAVQQAAQSLAQLSAAERTSWLLDDK